MVTWQGKARGEDEVWNNDREGKEQHNAVVAKVLVLFNSISFFTTFCWLPLLWTTIRAHVDFWDFGGGSIIYRAPERGLPPSLKTT